MATGNKITEKLEYKTDIITAYDGSEQRIKTRQHPRHTLSYDYSAMEINHALYLRGLMRMRQSDTYYVPMWHDVAYLSEDFVANGKLLRIDPKYLYCFDEVDYIEIFRRDAVETQDNSVNLVRRVERYSEQGISLMQKIDHDLDMRNTFIYPLKKCATQPTSGQEYVWSNGSEVAINYEDLLRKASVHIPYKYQHDYVYDLPQRNRWNIPEQYAGKEVFTKSPEWLSDSSVQLSVDKNVYRLDNETGGFVYDLINRKSSDTHTFDYVFRRQFQIHNIKKFFKRVCGKWKSFYMPTWAQDFPICRSINANDNAIYYDFSKLRQYYQSNERKKSIIIFTKDWHTYIFDIMAYTYEILEYEDNKRIGKLLLMTETGVNIDVNNILMCSYFNLVRLDQDELQLNYESNEVATTTMVFKEIDPPVTLISDNTGGGR